MPSPLTNLELLMKALDVKKQIQCPYCAEKATLLQGADARPQAPGNIRYGCSNGHKFAIPLKQALK